MNSVRPFYTIFMQVICILLNIVAGNLIIITLTPELGIPGRIMLSASVLYVLNFVFRKYSMGSKTKLWKKILAGTFAALVCQWLACIFIGASYDTVGSAAAGALKGAVPMFFISLFISPFWLAFSAVNVVFLVLADEFI